MNTSKLELQFASPAGAELPAGEHTPTQVHIWLLDSSELGDAQIEHYWQWLTPDERERARSFNRKRSEFILTRALVRLCLAHYSRTPPQQLVFAKHPEGKPFLVDSPLQFNLSHSGTLIALAVGKFALGVDIETVNERNYMAIAERYFHSDELALLQAQTGAPQRELFFSLWTLKEAFFKALGSGIATGLHNINLQPQPEKIQFTIAPELAAEAHHWQLFHTKLSPQTHLALAAHTPNTLEIQWFKATELLN